MRPCEEDRARNLKSASRSDCPRRCSNPGTQLNVETLRPRRYSTVEIDRYLAACPLAQPLAFSTALPAKMNSDEEEEERSYHHNHFLGRLDTTARQLEYEDYTRASLSATERYAAIRFCRSVERIPTLGVVWGETSYRPSTWRDALTLIHADLLLSLQREPSKLSHRGRIAMNNWCRLVADGLRSLEARLGHQYFDEEQPVRALLYLRQSYGQDPSAAQVYKMMVSLISSSKCEGPPN